MYYQQFVKYSHIVSALFRGTKQGINDKYFETFAVQGSIPQNKK